MLKNTQNLFAFILGTKYFSEAILYLKRTGGYSLSLHILTDAVAFLWVEIATFKLPSSGPDSPRVALTDTWLARLSVTVTICQLKGPYHLNKVFIELIRLGLLGYVNQVGLVSVCAKFQLSSWSRSGVKVPGGGV